MSTQSTVIAFVLAVAACSGDAKVPQESAAPVAPVRPKVTFVTPSGDLELSVEIADDPNERSQGLMHRKSLGKDDGMVFVFPSEGEHPFWMKNTYIPLDMMWVSADLKVVGIKANTEPLSTDSQNPGALAKYVIEVNGGYAAEHGIGVGTQVRFDQVPLTASR